MSEFTVKAPLSPSLRKQLERAIVSARDVAEAGARAALESLAVHEREPYRHMSAEQRALRNRLRVHGRQVGDRRHASTGRQGTDHLVHECAYEHWHGMLFARFLAENDLLIEPNTGVAVTLEECEELAQEEGLDRWTLASRYAHRMLPQVFRPDHPAFEVQLAREHRLKLEQLVEDLPSAVFDATDSLGWVYQFWQSRKKAEVNSSEVKIGANELPAVTQLFTEPYMVHFLLDNSLGAWWVARRLTDSDLSAAESEAALRRMAALPGMSLDYLRFVRPAESAGQAPWRPAAGAFRGWPDALSDLKILDPCCGSGHFLVAAFAMLVSMRMAQEGLAAPAAVDAVLRENLHGLELDPRCVAVAAFALAFAAWRWPGAGGYRPLPQLNLACSGLAPNATREEWSELAERAAAAGGMPPERDLFEVDDTLLSAQLRGSLDALHDLFRQAPTLGSLIDPRSLQVELFQGGYESVRELFVAVVAREGAPEQTERAVAAQGMARAARAARRPLPSGAHQRPVSRPRQAGSDAARLLRAASRCREERSGHRVPGALFVAMRGGWNRRLGAAAELVVPLRISQAAREAAEDADVARARAPRTGRIRDHQRGSRQSGPARPEPQRAGVGTAVDRRSRPSAGRRGHCCAWQRQRRRRHDVRRRRLRAPRCRRKGGPVAGHGRKRRRPGPPVAEPGSPGDAGGSVRRTAGAPCVLTPGHQDWR